MKIIFRVLLFPFSVINDIITTIRNLLFDTKIIESFVPPVKTIGVGNLTVGGTGKTPVVNYLIEKFKLRNIAVLSRGYGRKTKGFLKINKQHNTHEVGDEPKMLFVKNRNNANFFVNGNRVQGVQKILNSFPKTDLIILDDVYQHRKIKPKVLILLCDYNRPFYEDYLMPSGWLRESRYGAKRASIILVTKLPKRILNSELIQIENKIRKYCNLGTKIYYSYFNNEIILKMNQNELEHNSKVIVVSALANNNILKYDIDAKYQILEHFEFPDHYKYELKDIETIRLKYPKSPIITTEKDMVKIAELIDNKDELNYYIIVQNLIIEKEAAFINDIEQKMSS